MVGHIAPELRQDQWIDGQGQNVLPIRLAHYPGRFKVIYCFQAWCQGCHSMGFPTLQKMVRSLGPDDKVTFLAVQTVFEGKDVNTFQKILDTQNEYGLGIPFGHDPGNASSRYISTIMHDYRTGGTPWFIFVDDNNQVVFNDFHVDSEKAIDYLAKSTRRG